MSRHLQLPEGKRIHMYKSGDTFYRGISMVVNPKYVKNIDNLLSEVTTKVDPVWGAVRSIHTPNTGTSVEDVHNLRRQGVYVAAGPRGFVSIPGGYQNIGKPGNKKQTTQPKPVRYRPVQRKEIYNVEIYKNGDPGRALPYRFTKTDLTNWDQALARLSEKLRLPHGPVKRIYHLSGKILKNPSELVNNGSYVAATSNELFRRIDYGASISVALQPRLENRASESFVDRRRRGAGASQPQGGSSSRSQARERRRGSRRPDEEDGEEASEEEEAAKKTTKESGCRSREEDGEYEDEDEESNRLGTGRGTAMIRRRAPSVTSSKIRTRRPTTSGRSRRDASHSSYRNPTSPSTQSSPDIRKEPPDDGLNHSYSSGNMNFKPPSALETTGAPHSLPSHIPVGDLSNVDFLNLRSHQGTPLSSGTSSPQNPLSYRSRGDSVFSFQEPILEESEEDDTVSPERRRADRGLMVESRLSLYDSGHASLLSDEERPDSVFRARTRLSRPATQAREVDYDTDDGGIYRAKTRADYSRGAQEVLDSSDTNIELPIDLIDAAEVQEEVYAT